MQKNSDFSKMKPFADYILVLDTAKPIDIFLPKGRK